MSPAPALALALLLLATPAAAQPTPRPQPTALPPPAALSPPTAQPQPEAPLAIPARLDDTLTVGGAEVRARPLGTRLSVPVTVDGRGPFRFVVDSGADRTVIGATLAALLNLPPAGEVNMTSMAGTTRVATVRLRQVRLGDSEVGPVSAPALEEANLGAQGLIGIDALADQRLMLDFERDRVTVQPAATRETGTGGPDEIVVVARRRKGQLIITQVEVGDQDGGTGAVAVIDTGAEMTIGNRARSNSSSAARSPVAEAPLMTVTGARVMARIAVIPQIRVASLTLTNVPIAFIDTPTFALFGLADRPALLLGTDVLEAFRRVSLDFRRRRVRFVLRRGTVVAAAPGVWSYKVR